MWDIKVEKSEGGAQEYINYNVKNLISLFWFWACHNVSKLSFQLFMHFKEMYMKRFVPGIMLVAWYKW